MPYRKEQFVIGKFYHIVLKGIDANEIFKNIDDYYRGIFSIYEFNDTKMVEIRERRRTRLKLKEQIKRANKESQKIIKQVRGGPTSADSRLKLVEVLAFCIMPNHIHLLLRQIQDGGIKKFMVKFGTGYGGYFNRKYKHQGHVFQKQFTAVHIKNEDQLKVVFVYIHTNPVSLIEPKWKDLGIKDQKRANKFVKNYKWSSHSDYIGKKNFPSVTDRKFISKIMGYEEGCKNFVGNWIKYKDQIRKYANISLGL